MDIEFHYYMTYLISAKAGFDANESTIIAHSSQYVDDNDIIFEIDKGKASAYRNYISQTMNILKPKPNLLRIYPIFHFIPGDPLAETALRKDGKMHWLNTTPNSSNANAIIDLALASGNLYRIGIASHSYVDTWAHQNFVGYFDEFNAMSDPLSAAIPNIGHADAKHNPDWPALVWQDKRLLTDRVDNNERFMAAAEHLFAKYLSITKPGMKKAEITKQAKELKKDLLREIGERDQSNDFKQERIARYKLLGANSGYGDQEITKYDESDWFEAVVNEKVRGIRDKSDSSLSRWDPFTDIYTWKNKSKYKQSDWYRFQQAVKIHQDESWDILQKNTFHKLDLREL